MESLDRSFRLTIAFLLPGILRQFNEWGQKAPVAFREAGARVQHLIEVAETRVDPEVFASMREKIDEYKKDPSVVITPVTYWMKTGLAGLVNIGSSVVSLLIAPFFAYYLLLDLQNIRRKVDEHPTDVLPEGPGGRDATADADLHDALWTALSTLPKRQRAMVVLRYYEDLSEAETARVMGVSVGTVKSATSRALSKLREDSSLLTGDADDPRTTLPTGAPA